jgi:hypothetical protein
VTTPCTLVTGVPQLVRCQGDEVRFHLVGSLEREPCFALADEEPRAVEGERSQVSERAQQVDLVRPEERRVGAGPDDERAVGHVEPEDGRIVVVERVQHGRRCAVAAENTAFAVEEEGRAGADETRQWGENVGDDLLRRRQADEIGDRFPPALALLAAPDDADDAGG